MRIWEGELDKEVSKRDGEAMERYCQDRESVKGEGGGKVYMRWDATTKRKDFTNTRINI